MIIDIEELLACLESITKALDFRHPYASALIELGVDIFLLAKMLGLSSREQVFSTYGHLYPKKQNEAIVKIENCAQTVPTPKLSIKKAHGCGLSLVIGAEGGTRTLTVSRTILSYIDDALTVGFSHC